MNKAKKSARPRRGEGVAKATSVKVNREYKDTLFRMIFQDKEALLSLFNAVNKTDYKNPEELVIVTLDNAIYMNVKNDLAFIADVQLNLYEHQSTYNPNIPLRLLIYVAKEYQNLIQNESLYSSVRIRIPTPRFVVFYNGDQIREEREVMSLSGLFAKETESPELELNATVLNINIGNNEELLDACQTLKEYITYVNLVREYARTMAIQEAVELAVDRCIRDGVLSEFLSRNRAEAIEVSIFEYDEVKEKEKMRRAEYGAGLKDGREEGREEGLKEGREEGCSIGTMLKLLSQIRKKKEKSQTPEEIAEMLEEDIDTVRKLYQLLLDYPDATDEKLAGKALERSSVL